MNKKEDYILEKIIEIRFADPINALQLTNEYIIIGTMMGRITLYSIENKSIIVLAESNQEEISSISYNSNEKAFFVGIGDEEIKVYQIDNLSNESSQSISIYETDTKHNQNCENAFILLSHDSFFRVQLAKIDEFTINIIETEQEYELKLYNPRDNSNNSNNNIDYFAGKLPMTNYSVPFDFDGKNFLWVEFLTSSGRRRICVANIPSISKGQKVYKYELINNKEIGHISLAKLLDDKTVFIVHSLNKCEIRSLNEKFNLLESFTHIGEEVYTFDIYYENNNCINYNHRRENDIYVKIDNNTISNVINKDINNEKNETLDNNQQNNINNNDINDIIRINPIVNKDNIESNDCLHISLNNKKNKENDSRNMNIVTVDINGNVNLYKNKQEVTLFNMYKLNTIPQDYKDKQFFSMGYAYYIKTNGNYFCISSDHGCFVIKYNI